VPQPVVVLRAAHLPAGHGDVLVAAQALLGVLGQATAQVVAGPGQLGRVEGRRLLHEEPLRLGAGAGVDPPVEPSHRPRGHRRVVEGQVARGQRGTGDRQRTVQSRRQGDPLAGALGAHPGLRGEPRGGAHRPGAVARPALVRLGEQPQPRGLEAGGPSLEVEHARPDVGVRAPPPRRGQQVVDGGRQRADGVRPAVHLAARRRHGSTPGATTDSPGRRSCL